MGLEGYKVQVQRRLAEYGWTGEPPTERQYYDSWQSQVCAKKVAASHMRRSRKLKNLYR